MTSSFGKISKEESGYRVEFHRVYDHPLEKVWKALTDPEAIRIWFTDIEMDFREGGDMKIWFRDEARTLSQGKIVRIEPPHIFEFMWEDELAQWHLTALDEYRTQLHFIYSRIDQSYAASVPAGWHIVLRDFARVLEGQTIASSLGQQDESPEAILIKHQYKNHIMREFPELHKEESVPPVVVEKLLHHPVSRVWKALTDRQQMKEWYFDVPDFEPVVGNVFQFSGGTEEEQWLHECVVTEVIPMKRIAYTWRYPVYTGNSLVTFDLEDVGGNTRLRVTHSGLGNFPAEVKALHRDNFHAGWTGFIQNIIGDYLDKTYH